MIRLTQPLLPPLGDFSERLEEVWEDAWLTNRGKQLERLEARLKSYLRCEHLSLFCNGTMALLLGLRALKLQGEVLTTPLTFPATVHALDWAGLTPVFCDIDPATLCLDPKRVEEAITPRTSAILAVHVFGMPCDVHALDEIARKHGLKLVYDAAHAFGLEVDGVPIGRFGDMSMFSFHATKLFHTAEGGALAYADAALGPELQLLHNFGIQDEEQVVLSGINGKLNEIQAALGLCVMDEMEAERRRRASLGARYAENLSGVPGVTCVLPGPRVRPSHQYLPVCISAGARLSRDEVFGRLRDRGVHARRYVSPLCTRIPCYRDLPSAAPGHLPVAARMEQEVLCLPFHGALDHADVDRICEIIRG